MSWLRVPSRPVMWGVGAVVALAGITLAVVVTIDGNPATFSADGDIRPESTTLTTSPSMPPDSTPGTPAPSSMPPMTEPPPTTISTPSVDSTGDLALQELPPGAAEQFEYFEIGDPPCGDLPPADQPTVAPYESTYHILDYAAVCLPGFDQTSPIDVVIVGPDGQERAHPYPEGEHDPQIAQVSMLLDLNLPTGRYDVTASQSGISSQGSFMVEEPPEPRVRVVPQYGPRGGQITIWVAGLAPGEQVIVDAYASTGETSGTGADLYHYVSTITGPDADPRGRVARTLSSSVNDPAASYCLVPRGFGCRSSGVLVLE